MDTKALAKKIREAIFDQAETDGRAMHADSVEAIIDDILAKAAMPPLMYLTEMMFIDAVPRAVNWISAEPTEWR